ncbi:type I-U CRISPR-associated protein Csb2 [Nitratireductor sp. XY-223]|uniref:type I-G CRISPR-associated protein Csb2 n=1 Tax=Nitratireductor sp. XY-223 TaxID=2561926 RepID=UPI0010AAFAC3|nr:type I-U CRISPR-associated protein Csb2 [Nitratireductor sp. XY-223]
MTNSLLISIRFHDGRYHGVGNWPPSPARLFQALVAGSAVGITIPDETKIALDWFEAFDDVPRIAAPTARHANGFTSYVPNNDLDAALPRKNWDIDKAVASIRTAKRIRPWLFDAQIPFLYAWTLQDRDTANAESICDIAERLYQFGRGIDMAWAWGEILDEEEIEQRFASHEGAVYSPSKSGSGKMLACPTEGSLKSLIDQYNASCARFNGTHYACRLTKTPRKRMKAAVKLPPKPRFKQVAYESPSRRFMFDIRNDTGRSFLPQRPSDTAALAGDIRDAAAGRLKQALPQMATEIERVFVGRSAREADKAARIRITPLPSIGHADADRAIRRVLVEVPPNCPIPADDIDWTFSGLVLGTDYETGQVYSEDRPLLLRANDNRMLAHYGIDGSNEERLWQTVTAAALPLSARRRSAKKGGARRLTEEIRAIDSVNQALRHLGVTAEVESIRVQREPFTAKGYRAEAFAPGTRFVASRLWHVEITFVEPQQGPIVIGDGRYLGLGLMSPIKEFRRDALVFTLHPDAHIAIADRCDFLRAIRRALMSLSRDDHGKIPLLFSGHEPKGTPAKSGRHDHVFLAGHDSRGNGWIDRILVAAPWSCERSDNPGGNPRKRDRDVFDQVVSSLNQVRAGRLGVLDFQCPYTLKPGDPLFGPARKWESHTPYRPTRHASRGKDPADSIRQDIVLECRRRGLPEPDVEVVEFSVGPNGGNPSALLRLRFAVAIKGPVMLGRDSHMGGGLFIALYSPDDASRKAI